MAEHMIETRILLRYDSYSNWMTSSVILKPGEPAIAVMNNARSIETTNLTPANTPPAIGIKVGDGFHYFSELPWIQAVAGDVYKWAKNSTKPTYSATEIEGLQAFVEEYGGGGGQGGGSGGTVSAKTYQLVQGTGDNINKYYLQYKEDGDTNWTIDVNHYIDLSQLVKVAEWIGSDVDVYTSLAGRTAEHIRFEINKLDYNDTEEAGKVVTAVSETNGIISVTKKNFEFGDLSGIAGITQGGTGATNLPAGEALIGNGAGPVQSVPIDTQISNTNNLATSRAVKTYVDVKTAGLTGAMHFIGEATVAINLAVNPAVDPRIDGYNFAQAKPGDVILSEQKELVWTGSLWRLLGDEGSYAVKGNIKDADIDQEADIAQSKIANLPQSLASKVDKVEGKQLSTNDYTNEEKQKLGDIENGAQVNAIEHIFVNDIERPIVTINGQQKSVALSIDVFDEEHAQKLDGIQAGAQVNAIEHIFVNGEERPITTVNGQAKSVNVIFIPFTDTEKQKLQNIEAGAQVNTIEKITINGLDYYPGANKDINITLDSSALNLTAIEGARIPNGLTYEDVVVDTATKKLELARIAKTGNVKDLLQSNNEYITLYCGTSIDVI